MQFTSLFDKEVSLDVAIQNARSLAKQEIELARWASVRQSGSKGHRTCTDLPHNTRSITVTNMENPLAQVGQFFGGALRAAQQHPFAQNAQKAIKRFQEQNEERER